jgi:hypothetical protein
MKILQVNRIEVFPDVSTITLTTHLSIDRIDRLRSLCYAWDNRILGCVVAAVLIEDRRSITPTQDSLESYLVQLRAFEDEVREYSVCNLSTIWVIREVSDHADSYPINMLRNISLKHCRSELVLLLDVDCIPAHDTLESLCGTADQLQEIRSICLDKMGAVVIPCFESPFSCDGPSFLDEATNPSHKSCSLHHRFLSTPLFTTASVRNAYLYNDQAASFCESHSLSTRLQPFDNLRFSRGHRATRFDKWCSSPVRREEGKLKSSIAVAHSASFYRIEYEEGFEPYVVVARAFVPDYCKFLILLLRRKV